MYLVLKPEMRMNPDRLDPYLSSGGFSVLSRHPINNWDDFARRIYSSQYQGSDLFRSKLDSYLSLVNCLFGNKAVAFRLQRNGNILDNLVELGRIKKQFRADNPFTIPNLLLQPAELVNPNNLSLLTPESLDFFRYIHTPDAQIPVYNREMDVLRETGLLDFCVTDENWREMKQSRSFAVAI